MKYHTMSTLVCAFSSHLHISHHLQWFPCVYFKVDRDINNVVYDYVVIMDNTIYIMFIDPYRCQCAPELLQAMKYPSRVVRYSYHIVMIESLSLSWCICLIKTVLFSNWSISLKSRNSLNVVGISNCGTAVMSRSWMFATMTCLQRRLRLRGEFSSVETHSKNDAQSPMRDSSPFWRMRDVHSGMMTSTLFSLTAASRDFLKVALRRAPLRMALFMARFPWSKM